MEKLLSWHENFIKILEHALTPLGFAWIFDQVSEDVVTETRASFEGFAMLRADEAASVVVRIIEQEVRDTYLPLGRPLDADYMRPRLRLSRSTRTSVQGTTRLLTWCATYKTTTQLNGTRMNNDALF